MTRLAVRNERRVWRAVSRAVSVVRHTSRRRWRLKYFQDVWWERLNSHLQFRVWTLRQLGLREPAALLAKYYDFIGARLFGPKQYFSHVLLKSPASGIIRVFVERITWSDIVWKHTPLNQVTIFVTLCCLAPPTVQAHWLTILILHILKIMLWF